MAKFKRISVFIKSKKEPEYKNVGWFIPTGSGKFSLKIWNGAWLPLSMEAMGLQLQYVQTIPDIVCTTEETLLDKITTSNTTYPEHSFTKKLLNLFKS